MYWQDPFCIYTLCTWHWLCKPITSKINRNLASVSNVGFSQIYSKIFTNAFWNFPKIFPTYYTLHASHYACVMLHYEQHSCNIYCLNVLLEYLWYENKSVLFYAFQCILNVLLVCSELFNTVQFILYAPIVVLESIDLILASIMLA